MTEQPLTYEQLEKEFCSWWAESYPMAPPGAHAIRTHVAFTLWILNRGSNQTLR